MGLFTTKKANITMQNHRDEYYRNYFFNKSLSEGIAIVANIERCSKKDAAQLLMERGLSSYMGAKITEHVQSAEVAAELNQKAERTRFISVLRRYAKDQGIDISKFI